MRRAIQGLLALFAIGCSTNANDIPDGVPMTWSVSPARLTLTAGKDDTLLLTVLDVRGRPADEIDRTMLVMTAVTNCTIDPGWFEYHTTCELGARVVDLSDRPLRVVVGAPRALTDTLVIRYGSERGCGDPPECMMTSWHDGLMPLRVPVVVR